MNSRAAEAEALIAASRGRRKVVGDGVWPPERADEEEAVAKVEAEEGGSEGGGDEAIVVGLSLDEDFDWVTLDKSREVSWCEWVRGIIGTAIQAPLWRLQVVGVQRGSTRILLRCLPAGLPPPEVPSAERGGGNQDLRSAGALAEAVIAFAVSPGSKLP
ncbi:hypothetical protein T484DRAFT_1890312, partial [Baffinella frigidus]